MLDRSPAGLITQLTVGLALILAGLPEAGQAQDSQLPPGRRTMMAKRPREDEAIERDGRLDEPVGGRVGPATDFIQQDPDFGGTEPGAGLSRFCNRLCI